MPSLCDQYTKCTSVYLEFKLTSSTFRVPDREMWIIGPPSDMHQCRYLPSVERRIHAERRLAVMQHRCSIVDVIFHRACCRPLQIPHNYRLPIVTNETRSHSVVKSRKPVTGLYSSNLLLSHCERLYSPDVQYIKGVRKSVKSACIMRRRHHYEYNGPGPPTDGCSCAGQTKKKTTIARSRERCQDVKGKRNKGCVRGSQDDHAF
jgi:hypothetical protein